MAAYRSNALADLVSGGGVFALFWFGIGVVLTLLISRLLNNRRQRKLDAGGGELEDRLRFETLLCAISTQFLNLPGVQIEASLVEALHLLSDYLGADSASLYHLSADRETLQYAHGWRNSNATKIPQQMLQVDLSDWPWFRAQFLHGETIWIGGVEDLPAAAAGEQALFSRLGSHPILIVPVQNGETVVGLFTFVFTQTDRQWTEERIAQLRIAGLILSNTLERKRNEEALRQSEIKFAAVFRNIPVGILITRRSDGHFLEVNEHYLMASGYARDEVMHRKTTEAGWVDPEERKVMLEALRQDGYVRDFRGWFYNKAGQQRLLELSVEPVRFGTEDALLSIVRDVTERVQTEQALIKSEEKFAKAFRDSPDAVAISRLNDGLLLEVNHGYELTLGYTRDEIVGRSAVEVGQWVDVAQRDRSVAALLRGEEVHAHEAKFRRKDGTIVDLLYSCSVIEIEGELCGLSVGRDITDRKRAEEELRQSRQRLQVHMDHTPLGVIEFDCEGRVTAWNTSAERMFGYPAIEAIGKHWDFIVPANKHAQAKHIVDSLLDGTGGLRYCTENLRRDGSVILCDWFNTPLRDSEHRIIGVASLCLDVTERAQAAKALQEAKVLLEQRVIERTAALAQANTSLRAEILSREQSEAALRESETRFRELVEKTRIGYQSLDLSGRYLDVNPGLCNLLGYSSAELRGRRFEEFWAPKATQSYASEFAIFANQLQATKELRLLRNDGTEISVILEGRVQRNAAGKAVSLHCFLIDITQHKQIEEALLHAKEAAEAADRAKSMFIASMSHELRTPLNSVIGFTGVLLQGISGELNTEQRKQLQRVYASGKHLLALICDVIDISKIEAGFLDVQNESFLLHTVIDEAVAAVRPQAQTKNLVLEIAALPKLSLYTDRKRLLQCILNLLNNAVKYTERGQVTISANESAYGIEVTIVDTGIGIEDTALERLFQPFERLDSRLRIKVPGTGLGLYLTRKIMQEMLRGTVSVQSTPGVGSRFTLCIPATPALPSVSTHGVQNSTLH